MPCTGYFHLAWSESQFKKIVFKKLLYVLITTIMKQFFTKYFLRHWNSYFQKKKCSIIFINCGIFLCLQKNQRIFCSGRNTVKCHWEFVEFGGKVKQYTKIGSSLLLLPRNNTQTWHWTSFDVECESFMKFSEIDNCTDCSFILN